MEGIKDAFFKVKEDINYLNNELILTKTNLSETRSKLIELCEIISELHIQNKTLKQDNTSLNNKLDTILAKLNKILDSKDTVVVQPDRQLDKYLDNQTDFPAETMVLNTEYYTFSTNTTDIKPRNDQILSISTGNHGVQTDKQTHIQTNRQQENSSYNYNNNKQIKLDNRLEFTPNLVKNSLDSAVDMLDSLDSLKKEIRLKFKRLTEQELLVFSTIYQLEEELGYSDYKSISKKLNLTESSIRDYVRRLINKGIPIQKDKINNKEIKLSVSNNLKKIASLNTILELREI
ncbi:MAG: hypothetical protein ACE5RF_03500 [Nitrosarchaeum sp.]